MRKVITAAAIAALALLLPTAAAAQDGTGLVSVVHGVPDLPVDVYVNGELTLDDFQPGTITDPLELPSGDYTFDVRPAGADPDSDPVITADATLPAGANVSAVAHLTADGDPTLTVFLNEVSQLDAGQARVTVRHTAAAPSVDVLADGSALVEGLSNPDEAVAEVPAGTYDVAINAAGSDTEVAALPGTTLAEGVNTIAYAIGDLEAGTFEVLVQTISGLHAAPSGVPAGSAGLVDDDLLPLAVALAVAGAALCGVALRRRETV